MLVRNSPSAPRGGTPLLVVAALTLPFALVGAPPRELFIRGDANADGQIKLSDGISILTSLFAGQFVPPPCMDAADFDDSGAVNITDGLLLLDYLFGGGWKPPAPFPFCGVDRTRDALGCERYDPCLEDSSEIDTVRRAFGRLDTIAGKGEVRADGVNGWRPQFEGAPSTAAELSRPHIALADDQGNIYIADKAAHAIRKVAPDGTITTHAGTNRPGQDALPGLAAQRRLREPNGLWVRGDGTVYVLDTGNEQVKRISPSGVMTRFIEIPGLRTGRGLWVSDDETLAFISSRTELLRWTPDGGVATLAAGFAQLGNLVVDRFSREVLVTDRDAHLVYRVHPDGSREVIAGNGTTSGGGDGMDALETGLNQVRGIWPLEEAGGYFLATQAGSRIWYLDGRGTIHLFLDGSPDGVHAGDGMAYDEPGEKISNVRSITRDHDGNLLITEHDAGYVRRIEFLGIEVP